MEVTNFSEWVESFPGLMVTMRPGKLFTHSLKLVTSIASFSGNHWSDAG